MESYNGSIAKTIKQLNSSLLILTTGERGETLVQCKCGNTWYVKNDKIIPKTVRCETCTPTTGELKFKDNLLEVAPYISVIGEYTNIRTPIKVRDTRCGHVYEMSPYNLLRNPKCKQCSRPKHTRDNFIDKVKARTTTLKVLTPYINAKTPIVIRCTDCGYTWTVRPDNLLRGSCSCPLCSRRVSKKVDYVLKQYAKEFNLEVEIVHTRDTFDIYRLSNGEHTLNIINLKDFLARVDNVQGVILTPYSTYDILYERLKSIGGTVHDY